MTFALIWSAVLAIVSAVVVATAVLGLSFRRVLVALLLRVTDLGMATAVLVTAYLCHRDPSADPVSTVLWGLIAAALSAALLNAPFRPGKGVAGRAALLATQLTHDATTPRAHDTTDRA